MFKVSLAVLSILSAAVCLAGTPEKELQIKIVREKGLSETLQLNDCLSGTMYITNSDTPLTGAGDVRIGSTLELPWRANQNEISAIPAGSYTGHVREDGERGWRLELDSVKGRTNVQVHLGNWPKDSIGCILLGTSISDKQACFVTNSANAMRKLRELYASPNHTRPILVTIVAN
jgi:hypothetical protein